MEKNTMRVAKSAHPLKRHTSPSLSSTIISHSVETLKPFPDNPRQHSEKQVLQLMRAIKVNGFTNPVLMDESGTILSGHGRLEAAKRLGMATMPVLIYSGCSPEQKRAIVLGENRLAELSAWDPKCLKLQLEALIEVDFDVEITGFSTAQVNLIIDGPPASTSNDPQDILPPIPSQSVSRREDIWLLGDHKLICGDSREQTVYLSLLAHEKAQMVLTDAPYNVKIHGHARGKGRVRHREFRMASGEMSDMGFRDFLRDVMNSVVPVCLDGSLHYWFMDWRHFPILLAAGNACYDEWKQLLVWNKVNAGMGTFYRSQHELIAIFKHGNHTHINNFGLGDGGRYRTNVIDYPGMTLATARNRKERDLHPTVKPIGLLAGLIQDCSSRGGIILDPFSGSGSTILAAERTGRKARAIEIDPAYVDVALTRWQEMTGKPAILAGTNTTFDQVSRDRSATSNPSDEEEGN